MTGFGKASLQLPTKKISVEIKSLNSKNVDLNVRVPQLYKEKEPYLRHLIAKSLDRGKIEFSIHIENTSEETTSKINQPIIASYISQLKMVLPQADETELLKMAVRMPDALKIEKFELDDNEWTAIETLTKEALSEIKSFRAQEGEKLQADFHERLSTIRTLLSDIEPLEPQRIEAVKQRLKQQLEELKVNVDESRFSQELVYYIEKLDVNEEKVRLVNHLDYFKQTMNGVNANGRKLGFIAQEMGREINTLGSKANHSEIQKKVVLMKDELEKIKEQVLNIL